MDMIDCARAIASLGTRPELIEAIERLDSIAACLDMTGQFDKSNQMWLSAREDVIAIYEAITSENILEMQKISADRKEGE